MDENCIDMFVFSSLFAKLRSLNHFAASCRYILGIWSFGLFYQHKITLPMMYNMPMFVKSQFSSLYRVGRVGRVARGALALVKMTQFLRQNDVIYQNLGKVRKKCFSQIMGIFIINILTKKACIGVKIFKNSIFIPI